MHILLNSKSESDSLSNPTQVQFSLQTLTSISSTQSHLRISMFQSLTLGEIQFCICSLFLLRVAEVIHGFQPYRKPSAPPRSWRWKLECKRPFCANQTGEETRNSYKLYKLQPHFLVVFVIKSGAVSLQMAPIDQSPIEL